MDPLQIVCDGIPFPIYDINNNNNMNILKPNPNLYYLGPRCNYLAVDRHNTEKKVILCSKEIELTLGQWLDAYPERVYDGAFTEKRPSNEASDVVKGILQLYLGLGTGYYHGLGDPRRYGLQWVYSYFGADWDKRVVVHYVEFVSPARPGIKSANDAKKKVLEVIDAMFLAPGTDNYPPFLDHWHSMMLEWVNDPSYNTVWFLINHPCWWPWRSRLDYFETLYMAYIGRNTKVKDAIDNAVLKVTGGTEDWHDNIPKNTPFHSIFEEHKTIHGEDKTNLFLYTRAAIHHMHDKEIKPDPRQRGKLVTFYKYIKEGAEWHVYGQPMHVEMMITEMFPTLLSTIALELFVGKIYL